MKTLTDTRSGASKTAVARMLRLRWIIWLIPSLIYATSHVHRIAPTILFDDLMSTFRTTGASLGGLGSMYFYIYAVMQIPSGLFADTLGPRKTITAGACIGGSGAFVFGRAGTLWVAYLGRFLIGFGMSLIFICIMKLAAEWFRDHEFGSLSGLTLMGGNLGAMLATTPLYLLVLQVGWRLSYQAIGLATLIFGTLAWIIIRNRPAELGLPSAKDLDTGHDSQAAAETKPARISIGRGLKTALATRAVWPTVILSFGLYGTIVALKGMWLTPYLTQVYGLSREQATGYVLLSLIAGLFGPLLIGVLSDRIRRRKLPIMLFTPLYLLTWLVIAFWNGGRPPLAAVPILLFLLSIFCSPVALTWACAKEVSHPSLVGLATGIANIGGFLGGALMQFLFGYILDLKWQGAMVDGVRIYPLEAYQTAFIFTSVIVCISLASVFFIRETNCKNIYPENLITAAEVVL
ncbi:MAG: MFS transporter [Bacillota bacterium]|nr:MFS transporter [Bacillota bacterium]MDW7684193.1 MFS transporter [Bacillota bacterium]